MGATFSGRQLVAFVGTGWSGVSGAARTTHYMTRQLFHVHTAQRNDPPAVRMKQLLSYSRLLFTNGGCGPAVMTVD
jgi:hypothetical protein